MKIFQSLILAWVCAFLVLYPAVSYADDPVPITEGEPAPFTGVLLRTDDAARLLLNLEQQQEQCQAQIDFAVTTAVSAKQLELDTCNSNLQIRTEMFETQIAGYQDYNRFLENQISKPKFPQEVTFILGIVAGVGITIGAGYAINQVAQ
tara:strand:- start:650 stop:1096 length:447 start_codon:yes stop_codon:yes gene_type:complete